MVLFNKENEARLVAWKARNGLNIMRISLGLIFFWFGLLKFFPGLSPAEMLAGRTILKITFGLVKPAVSMPLLAVWECLIGLGLITGYKMRFTLLLLYFQMAGTFMPLVLFYSETWTGNIFIPTLLGQYIIKNIVLISAAIVIGATVGGGALICDPDVAKRAQHLQALLYRFRRRFHQDPDPELQERHKL